MDVEKHLFVEERDLRRAIDLIHLYQDKWTTVRQLVQQLVFGLDCVRAKGVRPSQDPRKDTGRVWDF